MVKLNGLKKISQFKKIISNSAGQFAIEAILLMSVSIFTFMLVTKKLNEKKVAQKLFSTPVTRMKNMTAYGTWREDCVGFGKSKQKQSLAFCHPNSITRGLSSNPNE